MSENNGRALELGKLIGSIEGFSKGQDALFRDLGELQEGISKIKQKHVLYDAKIEDNRSDINGIGKRVDDLKISIEKWTKDTQYEVRKTIRNYTAIIVTVLALFISFLTLWMHLTQRQAIKIDYTDIKKVFENEQHQRTNSGHNEPARNK